jgi:hypothetical protein
VWATNPRCEERTKLPEIGSAPAWRKSSRCDTSACVEVALLRGEGALVRDTKEAGGPILRFSRTEWGAFLTAIRDGDLRSR